jgi:hypothetical protein
MCLKKRLRLVCLPAPLRVIFREQLSKHVRQDTSMPIVFHFNRRLYSQRQGKPDIFAVLPVDDSRRCTFSPVIRSPSQLRSTDSSKIRIDTGSREMAATPCASTRGSEYNSAVCPLQMSAICRGDLPSWLRVVILWQA